MARPIATQDIVETAIKTLIGEGREPTILTIQERIGGGSFSTVKRWLDAWRLKRTQELAEAPPAPAGVVDNAMGFAQQIWVEAHRHAQRDVQAVRAQAQAEVERIQAEWGEAAGEVSRLEQREEALQAQLVAAQAQAQRDQEAFTQARIQAARLPDLERELASRGAELAGARNDSRGLADQVARLAGERDAAREQLAALVATLSPSAPRTP